MKSMIFAKVRIYVMVHQEISNASFSKTFQPNLKIFDVEKFLIVNNYKLFGISNGAAPQDAGGKVTNDTYTSCGTCPGSELGHNDWLNLFAGNTLASKYQDGHFAYAVIPGGGSGLSAFPPVMYVVDMENASDFNNVIEP